MEYKDWTITECIKKVNDSLFLPDIQRPYVWEEDDIYLLYDSICRDYPINTVLFWYLEKKTLEDNRYIKRIKFITQRDEENTLETGPLSRDNYYLAIDGQQRITSFFLTLKGTYKIRQKKNSNPVAADLYFNFLSGVEEDEKEMLYEFQFFPQTHPDVWVETIEDKKHTNSSYTKNWIRIKYIASLDQLHEIQTKVRKKVNNEISFDITDDQNGRIFKLWSKINYDKLITFYEERTQDYDKVLDIFIRTNSGGQKLSYSDLLFSYIKLHWNTARDEFNELLKELNEGGKYKFSHDFILKAILFFNANEQSSLKYRTQNFKPEIIASTTKEWEGRIVKTLKLIKDLINSRFLLTNDKLITSYNSLIPIAYFIYIYKIKGIGEDQNEITPELQSFIREWLITSMLTGVFGGQSDGILFKAKESIDKSSRPNYFPKAELFNKFNEAKPALKLEVTKDLISKYAYNAKESHLILSLLYNHSINFAPLISDNLPQQDHIISQSELKKAKIPKEKINSIFNLRYVTATDNKIKSDETFIAWSERLGEKVLQTHFIPSGKWDGSNFDEFLEKRKALFFKQIGIQ